MYEQIHILHESDIFQELIFWLGFLFFNFSLFAFNYFINFKEADFFPIKQLLTKGSRGVFVSANPDFFRFSIDLSILILLVRYGFIPTFIFSITVYYGFLIIFNTYHYSFNKIYHVNPIILNDLKLLKNGVGILWDESKLKLIFGLSSLTTSMLLLCAFLLRYLEFARTLFSNYTSKFITAAIIVVFIIALIKKGYKRYSEVWHRYLIHALRLGLHIVESYKLLRINQVFKDEPLQKHRRLKVKFHEKPNIYLLFIESYGSILLKNSELREPYENNFEKFKNQLDELQWGCKTNFSASVSLNGPSWLAYTSVLLGMRVDTNFYYDYLLRENRFNKFDTFTRILQNQGYFSYNLNATKFKAGVNVPISEIEKLYGINQFILRSDIPYHGERFGFTECPPDQYVLNYAHEHYLNIQSGPFVLFYLTKNSHSPFSSPNFVENWKDLNKTQDILSENSFLQNPRLENYSKSIDYQLDFIQDFIVNKGNDKDIFLLIGDHQPHGLCTQADGPETLVHVISKNTNFLSEFDEYGFQDSIENLKSPVKHEALYSIFLRSFIKTYGEPGQELPKYEPDGLQL